MASRWPLSPAENIHITMWIFSAGLKGHLLAIGYSDVQSGHPKSESPKICKVLLAAVCAVADALLFAHTFMYASTWRPCHLGLWAIFLIIQCSWLAQLPYERAQAYKVLGGLCNNAFYHTPSARSDMKSVEHLCTKHNQGSVPFFFQSVTFATLATNLLH